ncbi:autotransporter outer membrane beta-barrel domain-containing protein [Devosia sp. Root105]|uniref:autotransporter outer membrane beta-barrel domain-containing protein n=1 Tax=Devosia sp. Root105 TaxID=1736423 RepID=UPI0007005A69|nr:autotransporter outer membrane beta-barrel domain-containing protein [Devosia sp. Root105]KQU99254.1 hypothetical protein ASC68_07710 [Devosia sp. Root105]
MIGATPAFAEELGAACNINPANYYTCAGPDDTNLPLVTPLVLEPNGTFQVDLGPNVDGNPFELTSNHAAPALTIEADGYSTENNGIRLYPNSFINNAGGTGVAILNPGSPGDPVVFQIDDDWGNDDFDAASITGTTGIFVENDGGFGPGHIVIQNNGHVEGTDGAAIEATGGTEDGLIFELQNHSYESSIGAVDGVYVHDDIIWTEISNGNGLIAGLSRDGVHINNVDNDTGRNAVQVNNNSEGVIAGYGNGIYVNDVASVDEGNANVQINNDAHFDWMGTDEDPTDDEYRPGGLIVGVNEDGVHVSDIGGELHVNNAGTLGDTFDLSVLDPQVSNNEDGLLDTGYLFGDVAAGMGIWGQQRGVNVYDVGRTVNINNGSYTDDLGHLIEDGGLIVGVNDDAVHISGVEGVFEEEGSDSWYQAVNLHNRDGLMWGGDDGAYIRNADGNVNANNDGGTIFGIEDGLQVDDTWRGNVFVSNAGGRIQGFYGDGIKMEEVDSFDGYGGHVGIANGDFDGNPDPLSEDGYNSNWGMDGGLIWGADRGIDITDADQVWIGNGVGGIIVGDGYWQEPVINLATSNEDDGGADIINLGLMTSDNIPYFERDWTAPDAIDVPALPLDTDAVASLLQDYDDIGSFVWSGGQVGLVDNLDSYADAASDMLMWTRGGATYVENHGVMVGRVNMDGHNGDDWPDVRGNTVKNFGTWLVTDNGEWGTEMHGSSNDEIHNAGLIQTAFGWDTYETANFGGVNTFTNGGYYDDGFQAEVGLLSMIDDGTGDFTWIDHNFRGGEDGSLTSFVGLDVNFGPQMGPINDDPSTWRADYLEIEDEIQGSTGLIINKVGTAPTDLLGDKIYVAYAPVDANDESMQCYEVACVEGDTMYIDAASEGYINVDGVGAIQDGFYAWYLHEEGFAPDPDFVLESGWAPQAAQLPTLITAAQNIWHDTAGVVADHIYGNHFPLAGSGGAGADLPVGELPIAPDATPGAAVWAKATGNWTDQNTEVTEIIPPGGPVTIDTSFVQNTFSILGGVDFQPMGGGEDGLRAGVFGGYVGSNLDFDSYGAAAEYTGGVIGAYAAFTSGGFYADAEVKADLLNVTYTAPISPGFEVSGASTSIGILANTGYRMELADSAFFEPIASVAFVSTQLDGFDAGGASVEFSDGTSLQGGIGARVGVTLGTPGDTTTELAVLGKIWNEFEDANQITITDGIGNSTTFSDGISGVFGELTGTATVYSADRSFSAFGSAGVKFNEDFTSVDAKAGLRKGF